MGSDYSNTNVSGALVSQSCRSSATIILDSFGPKVQPAGPCWFPVQVQHVQVSSAPPRHPSDTLRISLINNNNETLRYQSAAKVGKSSNLERNQRNLLTEPSVENSRFCRGSERNMATECSTASAAPSPPPPRDALKAGDRWSPAQVRGMSHHHQRHQRPGDLPDRDVETGLESELKEDVDPQHQDGSPPQG